MRASSSLGGYGCVSNPHSGFHNGSSRPVVLDCDKRPDRPQSLLGLVWILRIGCMLYVRLASYDEDGVAFIDNVSTRQSINIIFADGTGMNSLTLSLQL